MSKKAHFIGICGAGMAATAKLLQEQGWQISGSDEGFYPPMSTYLTTHGLPCTPTYNPTNIPSAVDLVVIGKTSKLNPDTNPEVAEALRRKLTIKSFPEVLHDLTTTTENIVVVGSFGKTTCTGLLAWCLVSSGQDPSFFMGGISPNLGTTSHLGQGRHFILEGDEYPSAHWDQRSKFLHYNAQHLLLTSLEHDHVNVFPTLDQYIAPFTELEKILKPHGLLIACLDGAHVNEFLQKAEHKAVTYALTTKADWTADTIMYGETTTFRLIHHDIPIITLETRLLGQHNIQNIVGVAALVLELQLITPEQLQQAIRSFTGITRRLDKKTDHSTVLVYEGFGSSYAKARAAITAMKTHFPDKRLIVIFEPHTFSWSNRDAIHWYDTVFKDCDEVIIYSPPSHRAQLSLDEIVDRVSQTGIAVTGIHNAEEGLKILKQKLTPTDTVLLSTSGDLGGLTELVPRLVEEYFPA